jgi:Ca2+-binding EF-hand superfamily protein
MRTLLGLIPLLVSSVAFAVQSSPTASPAADNWKTLSCIMDKDKNAKLTQAEAMNFNPMPARMLAKNFGEIDANKDGVVTYKEYAAFVDKIRSDWETLFKNADTDKSGGLSKAELDKTPPGQFPEIKRRFDDMDANKDGQVTIAERDLFAEEAPKRVAERRSATHQKRMDAKRAATNTGKTTEPPH